tara:strand:- start:11 stop:640 length:630 start_codon:yes stop_codon:yes gene_type:complete
VLFYCSRHGESVFNAERRVQGQLDIPLSKNGQQQSKALASVLSSEPLDVIVASPLRRAIETAEVIATELHLSLKIDPRLAEINAGIFQGLKWDEIEIRHPNEAARWKSGDPDFMIPKGESRRTLMLRGQAAFEAIRADGHTHVAVIAHGGLLAATFKSLLKIPSSLNPFVFQNGAISRLEWSSTIRLLTLNEQHHLQKAKVDSERTGDL